MKIFISHSSQNKDYGNALVNLFRSIGLKENEIIFTSNVAYGIPIGQNIFDWLKTQIEEKPFVVYLLSEDYYKSIACLNEMGAAWIVENDHAAIFTPTFDLSGKEFQNGALDPREIGFFINDKERLLSFFELLSSRFEVSQNNIIISQSVDKFIIELNRINDDIAKKPQITFVTSNLNTGTSKKEITSSFSDLFPVDNSDSKTKEISKVQVKNNESRVSLGAYSKFLGLVRDNKLTNEELILLHYILDTTNPKLLTGWQEDQAITNIVEWESINELADVLSLGYGSAIRKFSLRGLTYVSEVTSSNNPKEVSLHDDIVSNLLNLPEDIILIIGQAVDRARLPF